MPNIEIWGFSADCEDIKRVDELEDQLEKIFKTAPYKADLVFSLVWSSVVDYEGKSQPFLRICWTPDTSQEEVDDIERRLCTLDPLMDMEFVQLAKFRSAKDIKAKREQALEKLKSLRPVAGTDPDFDYENKEPDNVQAVVDQAAENLKRDLGPHPITKSKMLD
ncbi:MAG: hypothetical protein AAB449_02035 [Patescibacteria group bacterium]|mgnify:CR=1 FL=1